LIQRRNNQQGRPTFTQGIVNVLQHPLVFFDFRKHDHIAAKTKMRRFELETTFGQVSPLEFNVFIGTLLCNREALRRNIGSSTVLNMGDR